jgi:uncharacterized membrane protein
MRRREGRRDRDEAGQTTVLIVGLAFVLAMAVAMVVDVSAAYLQRQGLDTVADGAALRGADLGATGREVYTGGVPQGRLGLTADAVRASVRDYLATSGAYAKYPGLSFTLAIADGGERVTVRLEAPLDLPLTVPGSPGVASIGATGSAVVVTER